MKRKNGLLIGIITTTLVVVAVVVYLYFKRKKAKVAVSQVADTSSGVVSIGTGVTAPKFTAPTPVPIPSPTPTPTAPSPTPTSTPTLVLTQQVGGDNIILTMSDGSNIPIYEELGVADWDVYLIHNGNTSYLFYDWQEGENDWWLVSGNFNQPSMVLSPTTPLANGSLRINVGYLIEGGVINLTSNQINYVNPS